MQQAAAQMRTTMNTSECISSLSCLRQMRLWCQAIGYDPEMIRTQELT